MREQQLTAFNCITGLYYRDLKFERTRRERKKKKGERREEKRKEKNIEENATKKRMNEEEEKKKIVPGEFFVLNFGQNFPKISHLGVLGLSIRTNEKKRCK